MKHFGAFEAKTHFSEILGEVINGEKFVITKHGVKVAMIIPFIEEEKIDPVEDAMNLSRYCNGLNSSSFPAGCDARSWAILNQYSPRTGIATCGENNLEFRPLEYRDRFIRAIKKLRKGIILGKKLSIKEMIENNRMMIQPPKYDLEMMLKDITPKNRHRQMLDDDQPIKEMIGKGRK